MRKIIIATLNDHGTHILNNLDYKFNVSNHNNTHTQYTLFGVLYFIRVD